MAYKEVLRVEIQEVIRRCQPRVNQRRVADGTGLSLATVVKYQSEAKELGIAQDGPAPSKDQLSRLDGTSRAGPRQVETPVEDSLALWADQIYHWLTGDRSKVTRVQEWLAVRGRAVSHRSNVLLTQGRPSISIPRATFRRMSKSSLVLASASLTL